MLIVIASNVTFDLAKKWNVVIYNLRVKVWLGMIFSDFKLQI